MSSANFESEIVNNLTNDNKITRAIIENLGNRVSMTDFDEEVNLQLFCYVRCSAEDEDNIKQCRGVVFNNENVVMQAFPYTIEIAHTEMADIEKNIGPIFENSILYL
jgi:hypothetical protein